MCSSINNIFLGNAQFALQLEGYFGITIRNYLNLIFGNIGTVIITSTILISFNSYILRVPFYQLFKPLIFIGKISVKCVDLCRDFIVATITEYKKTEKNMSLQLWLIHKLFFRKTVQITTKKQRKQKSAKNINLETQSLIDRTTNIPTENPHVRHGKSPFSLETSSDLQALAKDEDKLLEVDLLDPTGGNRQELNEKATVTINNKQYNLEDEDVEEQINADQESADIKQPVDTNETSSSTVPFGQTSSIDENFQCPSIELLEKGKKSKVSIKSLTKQRVEKAALLEEALVSFNVKAKVVNITPGPSVTRYELQPGEGVKISKITALNKDIALKLAAPDVRIEAPIPGKSLVGIEVPNQDVQMITLRSIIEDETFLIPQISY